MAYTLTQIFFSLDLCYSKCGLETSNIGSTGELVPNTESQHPQNLVNRNLYFNKALR